MIFVTSRFLIECNIRAITLFPFVFVGQKSDLRDEILINHEKIHIRQQLELLVLPFYIWYLIDFAIQFYKYRNKQQAYRNIIFEKEAYEKEAKLTYLVSRPFYHFLKFK